MDNVDRWIVKAEAKRAARKAKSGRVVLPPPIVIPSPMPERLVPRPASGRVVVLISRPPPAGKRRPKPKRKKVATYQMPHDQLPIDVISANEHPPATPGPRSRKVTAKFAARIRRIADQKAISNPT